MQEMVQYCIPLEICHYISAEVVVLAADFLEVVVVDIIIRVLEVMGEIMTEV
jgi:hypothetical protein